MAVFTKINKQILESFLEIYNLGILLNFEGIQEGVENSNYKIKMTSGIYILTIFEKRVDIKDLPFFIELKNHLVKKKFLCPQPIMDKNGLFINQINNKSCVINSFLTGKKLKLVEENHYQQLGKQLALMHINTYDFKLSRQSSLSQKNFRHIFENFRHNHKSKFKKYFDEINNEIDYLDKHWPTKLPSGIIHADIFKDNVFFDNDIFSGIIDFYFACNDYYAYELAICINAWCFNSQNELDKNKSMLILNSYQKQRKLTNLEKQEFQTLLRGAAIRFLLTRINDFIYHQKDAIVDPKDPMEFLHILHFHQNNIFYMN